MNREFSTRSEQNCFATAVVSTFFAPTNDLSLCNAGHPPPLLYRTTTRAWSLLELPRPGDHGSANIPLGILDGASYEQFHLKLKVGDMVVCYTDSLIESCDERGQLLGPRGLPDIVRTIEVSEPAAFIPALLAAIAAQHPDNLTGDDVTVLVFRPNGLAPRVPMREKFLALVRLLRGWIGSLVPGGQPMPWPELSLPNIGGALFDCLNRTWSRRLQSKDRRD